MHIQRRREESERIKYACTDCKEYSITSGGTLGTYEQPADGRMDIPRRRMADGNEDKLE